MPDSNDERYRKIFDYSNDAVFIVNPAKAAILEANPKACAMVGYPRQELLNLPLDTVYGGGMPGIQAFAGAVFECGQGWTNELTLVPKSGPPIPTEMSAASIDIEGTPCLLVLIRDGTAIKQVEEVLRKVSDELERVVEEKTFELRKAHEILQEQAASRRVAEKALRKVERELRKFQKSEKTEGGPRPAAARSQRRAGAQG